MDDVFMMMQTLHMLARPIAGVIGGFALLNLLGGLLHPGFDANLWWIDLRHWPRLAASCFTFVFSASMLAFACRPAMARSRSIVTGLSLLVALLVALGNAWTCYQLQQRGSIQTASPLPASLFVAFVLAIVLAGLMRAPKQSPKTFRSRAATFCISATTIATLLLAFPLLQIFCFGTTSYARPAHAIIVPGARAYADGRPSVPLADRVRTACDLYHQGLSKVLIFSGGPGDGDIHETESMRLYAISLGVPDSAILLDPQGLSTQATAQHTLPMLDRMDARCILVVSHFYHLPRLKLTYQRQGREVFTVPAKESYTLRAMPIYLLREVAALWWYYVRPVAG